MRSWTAVVLAAGEGTRLRPLTKYRPKPMLPAANRPILERVLDSLIDAGVGEVHLVVGYGRDRVRSHFGPSYRGIPIHYHVQEKQLGTGHAVLQVADHVEGEFLLVNGDEVISPSTVQRVVDGHRDDECRVTLAVVESDEAPEYGAVRLSGGHVAEFVEKPGTGDYRYLNVGIYGLDDRIFETLESTPRRNGETSLADALSDLAHQDSDPLCAVTVPTPWEKVDYPWDLLSVSTHLLAEGTVSEPAVEEGIYVADNARIHDDAMLEPPVVVSDDSEVGPGTVVGPYAALGPNVTVGGGATVRASVLDADTRVKDGATLIDCVAGRGVTIGPGTVVPGGPGDVRVNTRIFENRNLGALVADRAEIGGGATLVPGTLIGPEARVAPGAVASGVIEEREVVRQ